MKSTLATALIAITLLITARPASAQYLSSAGLQSRATADHGGARAFDPGVVADGSRLAGAAHGALIGAGIGAGAGVIVIALTPHSDHSEDAIGYFLGAAGGAFVGLIIGAAIGAAHPR